jgi:hypothetical protein
MIATLHPFFFNFQWLPAPWNDLEAFFLEELAHILSAYRH